jgi:hypothetical protein
VLIDVHTFTDQLLGAFYLMTYYSFGGAVMSVGYNMFVYDTKFLRNVVSMYKQQYFICTFFLYNDTCNISNDNLGLFT